MQFTLIRKVEFNAAVKSDRSTSIAARCVHGVDLNLSSIGAISLLRDDTKRRNVMSRVYRRVSHASFVSRFLPIRPCSPSREGTKA